MANRDTVETLEYKGFSIEIEQDQSPSSSRDWDNVGTMTCWHRNYILGDENGRKEYGSPEDFKEHLAGISKDDEEFENMSEEDFNTEMDKRITEKYVVLPLVLFDHSGISMSTSRNGYPFNCPWDSGKVGWIWVTKEKAAAEYGLDQAAENFVEEVENRLRSEVSIYDDYIQGNVYGYIVKNSEDEDIDSCWGYYGYNWKESGLQEAAENAIDCHIKHTILEHLKKLKVQIKHHVPLEKRSPLVIA